MVAVVERTVARSVEKTVGMYAGEVQARLDKTNPVSERVQVKHAHTTACVNTLFRASEVMEAVLISDVVLS